MSRRPVSASTTIRSRRLGARLVNQALGARWRTSSAVCASASAARAAIPATVPAPLGAAPGTRLRKRWLTTCVPPGLCAAPWWCLWSACTAASRAALPVLVPLRRPEPSGAHDRVYVTAERRTARAGLADRPQAGVIEGTTTPPGFPAKTESARNLAISQPPSQATPETVSSTPPDEGARPPRR